MKSEEFSVKISNKYSVLSKSHKLIADFILSNLDKAASMNVKELAEATYTSEPTISRFAKVLGYDNYFGLRIDLLQIVKNKMTTVQRINIASFNESDLSSKLLKQDIENIHKLYNINHNSLVNAAKLIYESKKIYVLGGRSSNFISGYLSFYLNYIFPDVIQISDNAVDSREHIINMSKKDILIAILFPRYTKKTINAIRFAYEKEIPIILITDSKRADFVDWSTITLYTDISQISFIDSLVAPMELINLLLVELSSNLGKSATDRFNALEKLWQELDIYD